MRALSEILQRVTTLEVAGIPSSEVTGIACDSRHVEPGMLFVCLRGQHVDGHDFLEKALQAGATCALVEQWRPSVPLPQIRVACTRKALAEVSCAFYGSPAEAMTLVGITGANGKTSSAFLLESILKAAGQKVGVIGTVTYRWFDRQLPAPNTTPLALELQQTLFQMKQDGVQTVVMEVSSHALALDRIHGLQYQVALFTNLTQDHLDFHETMESYQKAKERLFFEYLAPEGTSVINVDDTAGASIASRVPRNHLLTYALDTPANISVKALQMDREGIRADVQLPDGQRTCIQSNLLGRYNVYNLLGVTGMAFALGVNPNCIANGIREMKLIPGRLEEIPNDRGLKVLVDYAHTEDALKQVLSTLKQIPHRKIILVFGAGGDRDKTKRPRMGAVAAQLSDFAVLTSDNPRSEDPQQILRDIQTGMAQAKGRFEVIEDRAEAIRRAIQMAASDDIVLIAGKGHEQTQTLADRVIHFDDREQACAALKELK